MTTFEPVTGEAPLWAPWDQGGLLHLVADVPPGDRLHGYGACAEVHSTPDQVRGPRVDLTRAAPLAQLAGRISTACSLCAEVALVHHGRRTEAALRAYLAYEIRADLVCCDSYDVCRPDAITALETNPSYDFTTHPRYHDLCYWGESIAREVENPGHEDCDHALGSWFDRTQCAGPCYTTHDRCVSCGAPLDSCANRYAGYYERTPLWIRERAVRRFEARDEASPVPRGDALEDD